MILSNITKWFKKNIVLGLLTLFTIIFSIFTLIFFSINRTQMINEYENSQKQNIKNIQKFDLSSYLKKNNKTIDRGNMKPFLNVYYQNKLLARIEDTYLEGIIPYSGNFDVKNVTWTNSSNNILNVNINLNKVDYFTHEYVYPNKTFKFNTFTKYPTYVDTFTIFKNKVKQTSVKNIHIIKELKDEYLFDKTLYKIDKKVIRDNKITYNLSYNFLIIFLVIIEVISLLTLLLYVCWKKLRWKKVSIFLILILGVLNIFTISFFTESKRFDITLTQPTQLNEQKANAADEIISKNSVQLRKATSWGKGYLIDNRDATSDVGTISNRWYLRRVSIWNFIWNTLTLGNVNFVHTPNVSSATHVDASKNSFSTLFFLTITRGALFIVTMIYAFKILEFFKASKKVTIIAILALGLNNYFISYLNSIYWNGWIILALFYHSLQYFNKKSIKSILIMTSLCLLSFLNHNEHISLFLVTPFLYPIYKLLINIKEYKNLLIKQFKKFFILGCSLICTWLVAYFITGFVLWFRLKSFNINFSNISSAYGAISDSLFLRTLDSYNHATIFTLVKNYYLNTTFGVFTLPSLFSNVITQIILKINLLHHSLLFVLMSVIYVWKKKWNLVLINIGLFILPLFWMLFVPEHVYSETWWNAWLSSFSITFNFAVIGIWTYNKICKFYYKDKNFAFKFAGSILLSSIVINTGFFANFETNNDFYQKNSKQLDFNEQKAKKFSDNVAHKQKYYYENDKDKESSVFGFQNEHFKQYKSIQTDESSDIATLDGWQKKDEWTQNFNHNYISRVSLFGMIYKTNLLSNFKGYGNIKVMSFRVYAAILRFTLLIVFAYWILKIMQYLVKYKILNEFFSNVFVLLLLLNPILMQYIISNYWLGAIIFGLIYFAFEYIHKPEKRKFSITWIIVILFVKFLTSFEHISAFGIALIIPFIIDFVSKPSKQYLKKVVINIFKFGLIFVSIFATCLMLTFAKMALSPDLQDKYLQLPYISELLHLQGKDITKINKFVKSWLMFSVDLNVRNKLKVDNLNGLTTVTRWVMLSDWIQWFRIPFIDKVFSIKNSFTMFGGTLIMFIAYICAIFNKNRKMLILTLTLFMLLPISWLILFYQHVACEPYLTGWLFAIGFTFSIVIILQTLANVYTKLKTK